VVVPVLVAFAVSVTVCGVLKFDGVNVRLVGEAVRPEFPLAARLTVSLEVGACDKASVNVPVVPWVTLRLEGVAVIDPWVVPPPVAVQVIVGVEFVPE
jgi:hypothetical protein